MIDETERKIILVVEANPDDETLTLRTIRNTEITTEIVVVRDGQEALDYLFGKGSYADRDTSNQP